MTWRDRTAELNLRLNMIRDTIANSLIAAGITLGSTLGLKKKIELSDHTIEIGMASPDKDRKAWDLNMYKNGNVFMRGKANPIKPRVQQNDGLENPDEVDVNVADEDATNNDDDPHVQLISSSRYREYMRQDLISQLLTPESRWNLLVWAVVGLGVLQFFAIVITMWATGSFA